MATDQLSGRQEKFCREYVNDIKRNQTQAAIRAGYSPKSARIQASQNMKNPNIRQRIKELEREALDEAGYSEESLGAFLRRHLVNQVVTDVTDIVEIVYPDDERRRAALAQLADANDGQGVLDFGQPLTYIRPTSEWTPEERAAVKAIKQTKEGLQVEVYDKQTAIRLLADIGGFTKQSVEIAGRDGGAVEMNVKHSGELSLQGQVRAVLLEKLAARDAVTPDNTGSDEGEFDDGS